MDPLSQLQEQKRQPAAPRSSGAWLGEEARRLLPPGGAGRLTGEPVPGSPVQTLPRGSPEGAARAAAEPLSPAQIEAPTFAGPHRPSELTAAPHSRAVAQGAEAAPLPAAEAPPAAPVQPPPAVPPPAFPPQAFPPVPPAAAFPAAVTALSVTRAAGRGAGLAGNRVHPPKPAPVPPPPGPPPPAAAAERRLAAHPISRTAPASSRSTPSSGRGLHALTSNLVGHAKDLQSLALTTASSLLSHNSRALEDFDVYGALFERARGPDADGEDLLIKSPADRAAWRARALGGLLAGKRFVPASRMRISPPQSALQIGWSWYAAAGPAINYCADCAAVFGRPSGSNALVPLNLRASNTFSCIRSDTAPTDSFSCLCLLEFPGAALPSHLVLMDDGHMIVRPDFRAFIRALRSVDLLMLLTPLLLTGYFAAPAGAIEKVGVVPLPQRLRAALHAYLAEVKSSGDWNGVHGDLSSQFPVSDVNVLEVTFKTSDRKWRLFAGGDERLRLAHAAVQARCQPRLLTEHPAFFRRAKAAQYSASAVYDPLVEWEKMLTRVGGRQLRLSCANESFGLCATYPQYVVVPASISDGELVRIAEFRAKGRFPVLCWASPWHAGASLWRSSQPKAMFHRCAEDERLVAAIRGGSTGAPGAAAAGPLLIVDARSYVAAVANKAAGAGYESTAESYAGCALEFAGIANIHHVRDAHRAMQAAAVPAFAAPTAQLPRVARALAEEGGGEGPRSAAAADSRQGGRLCASRESDENCACGAGAGGNAGGSAGSGAGGSVGGSAGGSVDGGRTEKVCGFSADDAAALPPPVFCPACASRACAPALPRPPAKAANRPSPPFSEWLHALAAPPLLSLDPSEPFLAEGAGGSGAAAPSAPWAQLAKTGWYDTVSSLLKAANLIATRLVHGEPVLVHCSDGWDRTAQLCSLAILMVDREYRSLEGLLRLVYQEFVYAGHRFRTRTGHCGAAPGDDGSEGALPAAAPAAAAPVAAPSESPSRRAPIFTQWLDCVYQLTSQLPGEFGFGEAALLALANGVHDTGVGDFLFDCLAERLRCEGGRPLPSLAAAMLAAGGASRGTSRSTSCGASRGASCGASGGVGGSSVGPQGAFGAGNANGPNAFSAPGAPDAESAIGASGALSNSVSWGNRADPAASAPLPHTESCDFPSHRNPPPPSDHRLRPTAGAASVTVAAGGEAAREGFPAGKRGAASPDAGSPGQRPAATAGATDSAAAAPPRLLLADLGDVRVWKALWAAPCVAGFAAAADAVVASAAAQL